MSGQRQWPKDIWYPPFPVLQVVSTPETAQFNILIPQTSNLGIWTEVEDLIIDPVEIRCLLNIPNQQWQLLRVRFANLRPNTQYCLCVAAENEQDRRFFKTLRQNFQSLRFAFGNCLNDETIYIEIQKRIYNQLSGEELDFLILAGDLVYIDSRERWYDIPGGPQEKDCLVRYWETWQRLDLFRMENLISTLTIWDDHDYGVNDGDRYFPYKQTTEKLHKAFFGADSIDNIFINFKPGRGAFFCYEEQAFLLLDNRYFRLHDQLDIYPELNKIDPLDYSKLYQYFVKQSSHQRYNLLGKEQEDWFITQIKKRSPKFIWIVGGNQFFGNHHHKESYSGSNPEQFYHFLKRIKDLGKPFAILSGDIHVSEFCSYPLWGEAEPLYEFVVSPLHSTMKLNEDNPDCYKKFTNPYRIRPQLQKNTATLAENTHLKPEEIKRLEKYGLVCFRYNYAVFQTQLLPNPAKGIKATIKLVSDRCNPVWNFTTEIHFSSLASKSGVK